MIIVERVCDGFPTDHDLAKLEKSIGCDLPLSYRTFLLECNGGRPLPSHFSFTTREERKKDGSVHYFFSVHTGRTGNLEKKALLRGERIPNDFLPIAADPFGNLILIGINRWNFGKIYFWDHELEAVPPSIKNISKIADSFELFIDALAELDEVG
jgi:hypothetical protein